MNTIFADAFFFLALLNKRDAWHPTAIQIIDTIEAPIITTQWVLVEVADTFSRPADRPFIVRLLELIEADPRIKVIGASNSQFQRGVALYLARQDKYWSLTDCISFVMMQQRNIKESLTADQHFEQAGFKRLLTG